MDRVGVRTGLGEMMKMGIICPPGQVLLQAPPEPAGQTCPLPRLLEWQVPHPSLEQLRLPTCLAGSLAGTRSSENVRALRALLNLGDAQR